MSYESRSLSVTASGIQGDGSAGNPIRENFDNLPVMGLPAFITDVVITSSLFFPDGARIAANLFVEQFQSPWAGTPGNGITIIPGGISGHTPTIASRLSTDANNATVFGGDGGIYTPSVCSVLSGLPSTLTPPGNGLIPFYDPNLGTCRSVPLAFFGGGGGSYSLTDCSMNPIPNGGSVVSCTEFPTRLCAELQNVPTNNVPSLPTLVLWVDGLGNCYKSSAALLETALTVNDTPTVDLTASGILNHTIQADVRVSAGVGNQIVVNPDGLFVPSLSATTLCNVLQTFPVNNTPALPILIPWTDGLGNCFLSSNVLLQQPIAVVDTPSVNLTASGIINHTIQADVNISAAVGNQIVVNPDGLFVPAGLATVVTASGIQGDGSGGNPVRENFDNLPPVSAANVTGVVVSATTNPDGGIVNPATLVALYQSPWLGVAGNGITITPGNVLPGDGHAPTILARLSADAGNDLVFGGDGGLYVNTVVSVNGPVTGNGTPGNPLDVDFSLMDAADRCSFGNNIPAGTVTRIVGKDVTGCLVDSTLTTILAALPTGARGLLNSEATNNNTPANTYLGLDGQWHLLPDLCNAFNFPDVNFGPASGSFRAMFTRQGTNCPISTNEVFVNNDVLGIANTMEFSPGRGIRGLQNGIGPTQVPPPGSGRILSAPTAAGAPDWVDPNVALCRGLVATPVQALVGGETFLATDGTNCYRVDLSGVVCAALNTSPVQPPDSTNFLIWTDGTACFRADIATTICEAIRDLPPVVVAGTPLNPQIGVVVFDPSDDTCKLLQPDLQCEPPTPNDTIVHALGLRADGRTAFGHITPRQRVLLTGGPVAVSPLQTEVVLHGIGTSGEIMTLQRPNGNSFPFCEPNTIKIKVSGTAGDVLQIQDSLGASVDGSPFITLMAGPTPFGGTLGEAVELVWVPGVNQWIAL